MDAKRINDHISVSPQIGVGDIAAIAAAGFRSIICNRPDGESGDQTAFAEIEAEAGRCGIAIAWQPVLSGQVRDEDGLAFGELIERLPRPVLAYCRSGTRCTVLWALSQAGRLSSGDILTSARDAGYDLGGLAPRLEALARRRDGERRCI